jgi:hypothetical protein
MLTLHCLHCLHFEDTAYRYPTIQLSKTGPLPIAPHGALEAENLFGRPSTSQDARAGAKINFRC